VRGGDLFGHRHANIRDAGCKEPAVQRQGARRVQGLQRGLRVLAEPARAGGFVADTERFKLRQRERKEVERVLHQLLRHKRFGDFAADGADVERVARGKMLQAADALRRAGRVDAAVGDLFRLTRHRAAAFWAGLGHREGALLAAALLGQHAFDRGDHVTGLDDPDAVAHADVLACDLVGIVQRGARDFGAGE